MATLIPRMSGPTVQVESAPTVRNTAFVDTSAAQRAAQQIGGVAQDYLQKKQEEYDLTAVMQARRELSDWEASTFDPANPEGISKYRGKNAMGANEALVPDLDKRVGEIGANLTGRQRAQFEQVAGNFRDQVQGRLNGHMDRETTAYVSAEQKATIDNLGQDAISAGRAGDFGRQATIANEVLAINRARRTTEGMGEELIKAEERGIVSGIHSGTIDGMITAKPFEAQAYFDRYRDQITPEDAAKIERQLYPVVSDAEAEGDVAAILAGAPPPSAGMSADGGTHETFDEAMASLGPTEGGFQKDPDDKGNYRNGKLVGTNFGISARAHPNVDIANLTRAEAAKIYKAEYWDAIGADSLPPALRGAAFDAAVNSGVPTVKRWLSQSGGDVAKFQQIRRGHVRGIQAADPSQRKFAGGWNARMAKFDGGGEATAAPSRAPTEAEAIAIVNENFRNPDERAKRISKIRANFQLKDAQQAEAEKKMSEYTYTQINRGNPSLSLPELIGAEAYAYHERKGNIPALEDQRKKKLLGTLVQDDPILVDAFMREAALSPATFMKRNLYEPGVSARLSTDTMTTLLKMQAEVNKPEKQTEYATQAERIDSGLRVLGLDASRDPTGGGSADKKSELAGKRAAYGTFYREAERAFVQRTGKAPTPTEADALTREVTKRVSDNPWMLEKNQDGARRASSLEGYSTAMSDAVRKEAVASYRAKYGANTTPTEAEIVQYAVLKSKAQ